MSKSFNYCLCFVLVLSFGCTKHTKSTDIKSVNKSWVDIYSTVYQNKTLQKGIKSTDAIVIDSHLVGVAKRPVSSTYRLFSWVKGAAFDVVNPNNKLPEFFVDKEIKPLYEGPSMDLEEFEKRLDQKIGDVTLTGSMDFLIGGDAFFPRLEKVLRRAKKSIYLRTFIFDNDDYGVRVANILREKAKEGVEVKVLLDGIGQVMGEGKVSETLPEGFKSPNSIAKYLQKNSTIEVRTKANTWFKADHVKTTIIDEKILFTGGMNIGREYRYDWHDLMVEIEGSLVGYMKDEFDVAWEHAGGLGDLAYVKHYFTKEKLKRIKRELPKVRPLFTRVSSPEIFKAQVEAIKSSKKYIYINNAYFSDETIINELIKARRRGVDVRIILPAKGNHEIMNKNNVVAANKFFKNKVRVYFYPGMSHIKAAIYDGWMTTGSANFDKLSFRDNLEFNVATSDPETVQRFEKELFLLDFEHSIEMTEKIDSGWKEYFSEKLSEQL